MIAAPYRVVMAEGKVLFDNFDADGVAFPVGTTHLSLQFLLLRCDFEAEKFTLSEGDKIILTKGGAANQLELTCSIPEEDGIVIGLVFGGFFQEVNGERLSLRECGMSIVGVR